MSEALKVMLRCLKIYVSCIKITVYKKRTLDPISLFLESKELDHGKLIIIHTIIILYIVKKEILQCIEYCLSIN